jgi:hypothetical protein
MAPFHVQGIAYDPAQFQATIDWHDGTVTKGGVAVYQTPNDPPLLYGTLGDLKTMADPGTHTYTITISQVGHPEVSATGTSDYVVDDYPLFAHAKTVYANQGTNGLRNVTVATFDDGWVGQLNMTDATGTAANFTATIAWGDGSFGMGTIVADTTVKGRYSVVASHAYNYLKGQAFPVTVHVTDKNGGQQATAYSTATIYDAPLVKPVSIATAPPSPFASAPLAKVWDL